MAAAFAAPDPQVGQAGPFSPRRLAARGASISGAKDSGAGTAEAAKGASLLALKLETILALYVDEGGDKWRDLQQAYTVDWEAQLGRGSYGKVYLGTKGIAGRDECKDAFAIKTLRDEKADVSKGHHADAEVAADLEVSPERRWASRRGPLQAAALAGGSTARTATGAGGSTAATATVGSTATAADMGLGGPDRPRVRPVRDRRAPIPDEILLRTELHAPRPEQRSRGASVHPRQGLYSHRPEASQRLHARGDPLARLLWERGVDATGTWRMGPGGAVPPQQDGVRVPDPEVLRGARAERSNVAVRTQFEF